MHIYLSHSKDGSYRTEVAAITLPILTSTIIILLMMILIDDAVMLRNKMVIWTVARIVKLPLPSPPILNDDIEKDKDEERNPQQWKWNCQMRSWAV